MSGGNIIRLVLAAVERYGSAIFLAGLVFLVAVLTALRISGTSAGYFHLLFYGEMSSDTARMMGTPRGIRADEYNVATSWTVAQARVGFPANNPLFGLTGQKLLFYDIPVKDFTLLFKPHHWGFFIFPLEQGFAFKWWFRAALFLLATYLVLLRISKHHVLFSILGAMGLFLMPHIQWWYSVTMLDIVTYYFLLFEVFIRLVRCQTKTALFLYAILFAYLSMALILLFYPPTQASLGILFVIFALCFLWQERKQITPGRWKQFGLALGLSLLLLGASLGVFYQQYQPALQTINATVYPGQRDNAEAGHPLAYLLGGIFNFQLLHDSVTLPPFLGGNQSEAAGFFFYGLFLLPVLLGWLIWRWRTHQASSPWVLVFSLTFVVCLLWEIFGLPEAIASLPLIAMITPNRLVMPLGVLNLILVAWYLYRVPVSLGRAFTWLAASYAGLIGLFYLGFGFWLRAQYPGYLLPGPAVIAAAVLVGLTCFALLRQHRLTFALLLLGFAFFSTYKVNPIYRGLGELTNGALVNTVQGIAQQEVASAQQGVANARQEVANARQEAAQQEVAGEQPKSIWILYPHMPVFNLLQAAGVHALSGVYYYPDFALWRALDPQGQYAEVYNRYSHVRFVASSSQPSQFELNNPDAFTVTVDPCSQVLVDLGVKYHVFNGPNPHSCLKEIKQVVYPAATFYIYERVP